MAEINPPTSHASDATKTQNHQGGVGVKWRAPEFDYYPKTNSWYWWSIVITLLLLAFAIWQKNFLFAVFIFIAELLVLSWGSRKPQTIEFKLDEKGLTIGGLKHYSYADLKNFGASDLPPTDEKLVELVLYFKRRLRPTMTVLVPRDKAIEVEAAMAKKVPKIEVESTLLDALQKFFRF